jgi:two-component system sensor histidine kinase KdpD
VEWSEQDWDELLESADESLDRLTALVDNLLDLSRLQAGALSVLTRPTALEEVIARGLDDLGPAGRRVVVDLPEHLPEVAADPGLLERVVVNLLANAIRYSPAGVPPLLTGSRLADRVELRIIDRGPGIPPDARDRVFAPFQRLGDTDNTTGVGLGLALARGLTEVMGGTLTPDETPGGGLTMVVSLSAATDGEPGGPEPGSRERRPARSTEAAT